MVRLTEAGYQLSQEEWGDLVARLNEAREKVGGKYFFSCSSGWHSDQWRGWGVEQFPDLEAVQKYAALLNELNWFRYVESVSMLGTERPSS